MRLNDPVKGPAWMAYGEERMSFVGSEEEFAFELFNARNYLRGRVDDLELAIGFSNGTAVFPPERPIPQGIGDGDIRHALEERDRYRVALAQIILPENDHRAATCRSIAREALRGK